ncbi:MAG: hypothetical protein R3F55_04440 [Alphaproteobacteria bacterium]
MSHTTSRSTSGAKRARSPSVRSSSRSASACGSLRQHRRQPLLGAGGILDRHDDDQVAHALRRNGVAGASAQSSTPRRSGAVGAVAHHGVGDRNGNAAGTQGGGMALSRTSTTMA